jgi:hypothetical protein
MVKPCLDDLTGAANALLLRGEVDIYDTTQQGILKLLRQQQELPKVPTTTEKQTPAQWEYMGNQDGQMHGPYTMEQMIGWTQTRYFVAFSTARVKRLANLLLPRMLRMLLLPAAALAATRSARPTWWATICRSLTIPRKCLMTW